MIKTCLIDMDGVLVDFILSACKLHHRPYPYNDKDAMGRKLQDYWNMPNKEFFRGMESDFWTNIPWMEDGRKILDLIEEKFGPSNCCLCTAPSRNYGCRVGKQCWIERHLADYEKSDRVMMVGAKYFAAAPDRVLIDDKPQNIELFEEYGGIGILVDRPWNNKKYSGGTVDKLIEDLENV